MHSLQADITDCQIRPAFENSSASEGKMQGLRRVLHRALYNIRSKHAGRNRKASPEKRKARSLLQSAVRRGKISECLAKSAVNKKLTLITRLLRSLTKCSGFAASITWGDIGCQ